MVELQCRANYCSGVRSGARTDSEGGRMLHYQPCYRCGDSGGSGGVTVMVLTVMVAAGEVRCGGGGDVREAI